MRRPGALACAAMLAVAAVAGCGSGDEPAEQADDTRYTLAQSAKEACRDAGRAPAASHGLRREGRVIRLAYRGSDTQWPCNVVVLPSTDGLEVSVNKAVPATAAEGDRITWCVEARLPARVARRPLEIAVRREPTPEERGALPELLREGEGCVPTPLRVINLG